MRAASVWLVTIGCAALWGDARFTDPHGFRDAAEMYRTAAVQPFDDRAAALMKTVDAKLKAKLNLEDDRVWGSVVGLNPYRQAPQVQEAVEKWVAFYAGELRPYLKSTGTSVAFAASDAFDRANTSYRSGSFEAASTDYRKALVAALWHYDARNNLALAQMRLGNDLTAEMELLILRQLNESYLTAAVNLTVVYERLGLGQKARELADRTADAGKELPQAVFNTAWYKDVEGSHTAALALLTPMAGAENAPESLKSYKALLEKTIAKEPGFWSMGLAGRAGAYGSTGVLTLLLGAFVGVSLIVMAIMAGASSRRNKPGFGTFIVFVFAYLVSWGVPEGGWWLMMAVYVLVFLSMARSVAAN
jgi:hypothetical protein